MYNSSSELKIKSNVHLPTRFKVNKNEIHYWDYTMGDDWECWRDLTCNSPLCWRLVLW